MWKLTGKNLWARRRKNGWLLAELILVSIISWVVLDPVIVLTHDRNIPLGYDADRLCMISLGALHPEAPGYDAQAQDSAELLNHYRSLVLHVKTFEGVEQATPLLGFCYPNSPGNSSTQFYSETDTVPVSVVVMQFLPHTHFFETYGFGPGKGRTPAELSDYAYAEHDIVLTENAAEQFFQTSEAQGRRCVNREQGDTTYLPVAGTVQSFKAYSDWRPVPVAFLPFQRIDLTEIPENAKILVRLREGVSMDRFLHEFRPWMVREMRRGNLFARNARSYRDVIAAREAYGTLPIYRRNLTMAGFFLINLCLGVIGTFWLQTRTRREEVGVMLSFGATRGHIVRLLMAEGALLTFMASSVGFLLYLQYAMKEGLYKGVGWMPDTETYWVSHFASHFFIVSFLIFVLLLLVVWAGIYIPARSISRISPTEALRDE